jgi:hypothetical protein
MLREIGVSAAATVLSIVDVRQGNRMTFRTRRRSASALVGRPGLTLIVLSALARSQRRCSGSIEPGAADRLK